MRLRLCVWDLHNSRPILTPQNACRKIDSLWYLFFPHIFIAHKSAVVNYVQAFVLFSCILKTDAFFSSVHTAESFVWTKVEPSGKGPCPRRRQCCCMVGDRIILFGGTRWGRNILNGGGFCIFKKYPWYLLKMLSFSLKLLQVSHI